MGPERSYYACPHCGAEVQSGAHFCRECGSDAGTGWADPAEIDSAAALAGVPHSDERDVDDQPKRRVAGAGAGASKLLVVACMVAALLVIATGGSRIGLELAAITVVVLVATQIRLLPAGLPLRRAVGRAVP